MPVNRAEASLSLPSHVFSASALVEALALGEIPSFGDGHLGSKLQSSQTKSRYFLMKSSREILNGFIARFVESITS